MVDRRKLAVFDLDGTLYRGSSLREYFKWGVRRLVMKGHLIDAIIVAARCIGERCKWISHLDMKRRNCLIMEKHMTERDNRKFVEILIIRVNPEVAQLLGVLKRQGYATALASASPESYCRPLSERFGMDYCIATAPVASQSQYVECRGEEKLKRVMQCDEELDVVVTDHHDDLPLLKKNSKGSNYIVKSKATDLLKINDICNCRLI